MHPTDFVYQHQRTSAAGAAEAAPADFSGAIVWNLRPAKLDALGEKSSEVYDALLLLSHGATITYELAYWNTLHGNWVVFNTGTLTNDTPLTVPFPYEGAYIYVRKTNVTGADTVLFCQPKQAAASFGSSVVGLVAHQEDTPHTSGDWGVLDLAVRHDTLSALAGTDLDYAPFQVDALGALWTVLEISADSVAHREDALHVSGDAGVQVLAKRTDSPATSAGSDGDYCTVNSDSDGYLYQRSKAYDAAATADKVYDISPLNSKFAGDLLLDTASLTLVGSPYYYPSSSGASIDFFKDVSFHFEITSGANAADAITVTVEGNDDTGTFSTWVDITAAGYSLRLNAAGSTTYAATCVGAGAVTLREILDFDEYNASLIRVKIAITGHDSGAAKLYMRRKAL